MKERASLIGQEVRIGKKRKGRITKFTPEQEEGQGIYKLPFYTAEVDNPWGTDEIEIPEVALREEKKGSDMT